MNNEIKILLTINLEGGTLVRKSEPEVIEYVITKKGFNSFKKGKGKGNEVVKRGKFKHYPLVAKPATQYLHINKESYYYMISSECPYWIKPNIWEKMTTIQRLEAHLKRTSEYLGGKSFTYKVLED